MANHHQHPHSPGGLHLQHGVHGGQPQVNGHVPMQAHHKITPAHLASQNESVWLGIGTKTTLGDCTDHRLRHNLGSTCELQGDSDGALFAYEQALRHNFQSIQALNAISCILRTKENFPRAVEYLQTILKLDQANGEVWGSLGSLPFACSLVVKADQGEKRALLPHDGRPSASVCSISTSVISPSRSQSKCS